ncbi:putative enoyl reductase [Lachnellula suecica]|uniref:very-long-chain enoyl-CoA reductase n=1 Tax=Lachnellula suecica TaxID=602035 RepID=A0A8T9CND7_9HELO|nr:putative enoyl reductase [Lachnellula suecica]
MTTLKVSSRIPKKPIKKLPTSIEITDNTTVQDVKEKLARPGGWDPERFGIYDSSKKLLKDRKAIVSQQESVMSGKEIAVKDLGPQLSWTTVFIIEYLGPIIIHLATPLLRPYLYRTSAPFSSSQYLAMFMVVAHFLKREYETLFVHKFSLATMPLRNIFKNSAHYWFLSGFNMAYWIYAPTSYTADSSATIGYLNAVGLVLFFFGEISNLHTHITLSNLRSRGGTERGIPKGYGFDLVTCPNYMFEIISWTGVLFVTRSWATVLFMGFAWFQMHLWAIKKEKALRKEFPDTYKKKRYVLMPSPGAVVKALVG